MRRVPNAAAISRGDKFRMYKTQSMCFVQFRSVVLKHADLGEAIRQESQPTTEM
jgi:hypothetical protein